MYEQSNDKINITPVLGCFKYVLAGHVVQTDRKLLNILFKYNELYILQYLRILNRTYHK